MYDKPKVTIDLEEYQDLLKHKRGDFLLIPHKLIRRTFLPNSISKPTSMALDFNQAGIVEFVVDESTFLANPDAKFEFYILALKP